MPPHFGTWLRASSLRAAFGSWGAFGAKFASKRHHAPTATPSFDEAARWLPRHRPPRARTSGGVDVPAPHNETSTGVISPSIGSRRPTLTLVDSTSIAGLHRRPDPGRRLSYKGPRIRRRPVVASYSHAIGAPRHRGQRRRGTMVPKFCVSQPSTTRARTKRSTLLRSQRS